MEMFVEVLCLVDETVCATRDHKDAARRSESNMLGPAQGIRPSPHSCSIKQTYKI